MSDLTCRELVELVTDYLDGALEPADRARFERHLDMCEGCREHLDQMQVTVRLLQRSGREAEPDEGACPDELLHAFRDWKRAQP